MKHIIGTTFSMANEKISIEYQENQPVIEFHGHDFIEFAYILSGKINHNLNGVTSVLEPGNFILIDDNSYHSYTPIKGEKCALLNVMFLPSFVSSRLSDTASLNDIFHSNEICYDKNISLEVFNKNIYMDKNDEIKNIILKMQEEFVQRNFGYDKILHSYIIMLLITTIRMILPNISVKDNMSLSQKVILYMEQHYEGKCSLAEVSEHTHYNPQYICNKFKQETGFSFSYYLQKIRMNKACKLLINTDMKISEIAHEVGYSDLGYFEKTFLKHVNRTPVKYRKFWKQFK